MARQLSSRPCNATKPSVSFLKIHPSGNIETIMGAGKQNRAFSPLIERKVEAARRHFSKLGAEDVFKHAMSVLKAAIEAKLLDPHAGPSDMFSLELVDQILYHSLDSESYLPTDVEFSPRFGRIFELQQALKARDASSGERSEEYVRLLNDSSTDPTDMLIALYTRIADMMTVHAPETVLASRTRMPGVFPVHSDWRRVQGEWADPMLTIYCPITDWSGNTAAYRQMRDNAMRYRHPQRFMEVAREARQYLRPLENTNTFLLEALKQMSRKLGLNLVVGQDYRKISAAFPVIGQDTLAVAIRPFKGVGGLLHKSMKKDLPIRKIHDWAGLTVITAEDSQMYDAAGYLYESGLRSTAAHLGVPDICVNEPEDFAKNPKPVTNYQSVHVDVATSHPDLLPSEYILRTLDMHRWADEGEANHDRYKGCPLVNGERKRLMQRLAEIRAMARAMDSGQPYSLSLAA